MERVEALEQTRLLQSGLGTRLKLEYQSENGLHVNIREPDEEALVALLVAFRPMISAEDPSHLLGVIGLCDKHLTSDQLRQALREVRAAWLSDLRHGGIRIECDGKHLSPEHSLDLWINGIYFHPDEDKRRELRGFAQTPAAVLMRWKFLEIVTAGVGRTVDVGSIVAAAFQGDHFRFDG